MRLGIRRKLIGTLILVGLIPLALSLVVILGGGAVMRLHSVQANYEHSAERCADLIADMVSREMETLTLISRQTQAVSYAQDQTNAHRARVEDNGGSAATRPAGVPGDYAKGLDARWKSLKETEDPLRRILNNPLAEQLRLWASLNGNTRQVVATAADGEVIAADVKPADYFDGDEPWWTASFAGGKGRAFVSSIVTNRATGHPCIQLAVPIYGDGGKIVGVIEDKLDLAWLQRAMADVGASGQLFDQEAKRSVFASGDGEDIRRAEKAYLETAGNRRKGLINMVLGDFVTGVGPVPLEKRLEPGFVRPGLAEGAKAAAQLPTWVVLVSKPAQEAMTPVYHLALTVAGIGMAVILVLFILGVAISNREIIMPILRLREATAAVGRGELNVRLLTNEQRDPTFRSDELGQLAHDFDDMTRQLQKNVGQLARSNEAKRRFMELAGHELKTPVTYIIGVCQLAQRQLQAPDGVHATVGEDTGGPMTAQARSVSAVNALAKVSVKAQRLSRIVENLLKLVTNDQFTTRLLKQPIDMRALILQVCTDARPFINERKQQLICDVAENLPNIDGDRDKLEDALTNLLSNAIRFSPDGSTVKVAARAVVGDMLEILVEDSGSGIPAADLANLFEPFYTGSDIMHHHSGTIEYGSKGIGLGLAIVRRFVEIHGGVVRANSTSHGTQFQILLPLSQTAP